MDIVVVRIKEAEAKDTTLESLTWSSDGSVSHGAADTRVMCNTNSNSATQNHVHVRTQVYTYTEAYIYIYICKHNLHTYIN